MQLFTERDPAPNPRRVRLFLAAKNARLPETRVDLRKGEHRSPDFLVRNSLGQTPVLELDDGTTICESVSICRFLESVFPDPPLFGACARTAALIDMWIRRVEFVVMSPVASYWRHAHPLTAHLSDQNLAFGRASAAAYVRAIDWLERDWTERGRNPQCQVSGGDNAHAHVAADGYSMADIALITTVDFATLIGLELPASAPKVRNWRAQMSARPGVGQPPPLNGLAQAPATEQRGDRQNVP